MEKVIIAILCVFIGYAIGRIGHIKGGDIQWVPHHWIPGIILVLIGLVWFNYSIGLYFLTIGMGLVISDLKDFYELKIWEPDKVKFKKFWHID